MLDTGLTSAERNPFYLLATTYGEHSTGFDGSFEEKNRRIWNGFMAHTLKPEFREKLAKALEKDPAEFLPLTDQELKHVEDRFDMANISFSELPAPETMHGFSSISFRDLVFQKSVLLSNRIFPFVIDFSRSKFCMNFSMQKSILTAAHFSDAHFQRFAYFNEAKMGNIGWVGNAVEFRNARFCRQASFSKAQLKNADFTKAKFEEAVRFDDTIFYGGCPKFYDAALPEDTVFPLQPENWGFPTPSIDRFGTFKPYTPLQLKIESNSFTALRRRMEELQRPEDAHFFTRMEFRAKGEPKGWYGFLVKLYGWFSNYGYSIGRPLAALGFLLGLGSAAYFGYFISSSSSLVSAPDSPFWTGVGYSISNTFSFFGLGKLVDEGVVGQLPPVLKLFAGIQTVFGLIFSFLLGLGLRNHFRVG
ncbi:pentapeptide repeat-containing protein [Leisingera daeponensis]|uniref:pentapeptide repeat-containing protein n=1 Tax=Leisingera daeponensis TaxID=405746 RepID=UPI000407DEE7|nr:pentapeptide repeat-containing protein [Leisingera daeponensis]